MNAVLTTERAVAAAIANGSRIALSAYVLHRGSPVEIALEAAADRGARVAITLDGAPYEGGRDSDGIAQTNAATATSLRLHGVAVRLTTAADVPEHMKAAVVDRTAFLDDRNWSGDGEDSIVKTTDPAQVAAVRSALAGKPAGTPELALDKAAALRLEADAISTTAGDHVDVETESFGYSAVYTALRDRAEHGDRVRLLVTKREFEGPSSHVEQSAIRRLRAAGVEVRVSIRDEKFCVAGDRGWVGSANATDAHAPIRDWGLRTHDPTILAALEARFEAHWAMASVVR